MRHGPTPKGAQENYYKSVVLCKSFHDKLASDEQQQDSQRAARNYFEASAFCRTVHVIEKVPDEEITAATRAMEIAKCIY